MIDLDNNRDNDGVLGSARSNAQRRCRHSARKERVIHADFMAACAKIHS